MIIVKLNPRTPQVGERRCNTEHRWNVGFRSKENTFTVIVGKENMEQVDLW